MQLSVPDLVGVVLYPAGLGIDLRKLLLRNAADLTLLVEQDPTPNLTKAK